MFAYTYDESLFQPQDLPEAQDQPEPVKLPEIPPEVWNTRPIDGQKCVEATRALCG